MNRKYRFGRLKILLVISMVVACLSAFYVNAGAETTTEPASVAGVSAVSEADSAEVVVASATVDTFEEDYRNAVYNIKHTSPLNEEIEDEEYVDPLTGNLTVKRTDLSLPGINGLDLELTRYFTPTNAYLGTANLNNPNFEYVYMVVCTDESCEAHDDSEYVWQPYEQSLGNREPRFQHRVCDWLTYSDACEVIIDEPNSKHTIHESQPFYKIVTAYDEYTREDAWYYNASGAPRIFGIEEESKEKISSTQPYSLGASWAFDFPYVENVVDDNVIKATYLHLGSRGTWKADLSKPNGLSGYAGQDVCFASYGTEEDRTYKYYEKNGLIYTFNENGLIQEIKNQYGNNIVFEYYNETDISAITDSCGRKVVFSQISVDANGKQQQKITVEAPDGQKTNDKGGIDKKEVIYNYEKVGTSTGLIFYQLVASYADVNEEYRYTLIPRRYMSDVTNKSVSSFRYNIGDIPEKQAERAKASTDRQTYFSGTNVLNSIYLSSINIEGSGYRNYEYTYGLKKKLGAKGIIEFAKINRIFDTDDDIVSTYAMGEEEPVCCYCCNCVDCYCDGYGCCECCECTQCQCDKIEVPMFNTTTGQYDGLVGELIDNETKYIYTIKNGYEYDGFKQNASTNELSSIEVTMEVANDSKTSTTVTNGLGFLEQTIEENPGGEKVTTTYTNNDKGWPALVKKSTSNTSGEIYSSCENFTYNEYGDVTAYYKPSAPRNADGIITPIDGKNPAHYCTTYSYLQKMPGDNGLLYSYLMSTMYYNDANTVMREENLYATNNTLTSTTTRKLEIGEDSGFVNIRWVEYIYDPYSTTKQPKKQIDHIDCLDNDDPTVTTSYTYGEGANQAQVIMQKVEYGDSNKNEGSEVEITETEYDYFGNEIKSKDELGVTNTTEYSENIRLGAEDFEVSAASGGVEGSTTVSTAIDTTTYETTEYSTDLNFTATTDQYGRREVSINAPNGNEVLSYSSDSGMLTLNKYDNNSKVILEKVYIVKGSKDVSDSELKRISNAFYTTSATPTSTLRTYEQYSVAEYRYNSVGELVEKKEKGSGSEYISFETYSTTVSKTNDGYKCTQSSTIEFKPNEVASGDSLLRQMITKAYTDKNDRTIKTESQTVKFFNGNPKVVTTTTVNEYDDISDRLTKVTTTYTDNSGNTETKVTEYEYDYLGNQSQVIREDGTSNLTEYNALGQAVRSYDYVSMSLPKDERYYTQTEYYHNGSVKKTTVPIDENTNQTTEFLYDAAGNTIRETVSREDGKSEVTEYEYDAGNRLTTVINYTEEPGVLSQGKKQITQYLYDSDGNEIRRYTGLTEKLHIELKKVHDPYATASPSASASPTPTPSPVALHDEVVEEYKKGEAIYSIRVGFEEEAQVQDYRVSKYSYDLENKLKSFTDPDGRTETYTYDFKGNLTKTVDKEGNVTNNTYDTRQRLIKSTVKDAEGKDSDIVNIYTYNTLNELEKVNDKTYTFDVMSRVTKVVDTGLLPNKAVTTEYGYRVDGVQTSKKISVGNAVKLHQKYSYDPIDRLSTVYVVEDGTESSIVSYQYDNNGNRTREFNGNKETVYQYNYNNQVTKVINRSNYKDISVYDYTYNEGGYQDGKTETTYSLVDQSVLDSSSTTYQYDLLGRLTKEATGDDSISYEYDKYNNRNKMTVTEGEVDKTTNYHYNKNDELLSEATEDDGNKQITNYWYDLNGNQIVKSYANVVTNGANVVVPVEPSSAVPVASASVSATDAPNTTEPETDMPEEDSIEENSTGITIQATTDNPDGAIPQLTEYDALNRQTKVKIGNNVYKYGYNEDGLRTWKMVNGEKTYFVWDDNQIVLELDENVDVNKKHVRGLTLLYSEDDNASTDDKVFYNYNAHGDVVQLLDVNGNVTKYYQYDSFGNEINEDDNDQNPWRYCGEYYDKETGTIYLRARYYAPGYGRFTTRDTYTGEQKDPLSLNLYTYCHGDPVNYFDPTGHWGTNIHKKITIRAFKKSKIKKFFGLTGARLRNGQ